MKFFGALLSFLLLINVSHTLAQKKKQTQIHRATVKSTSNSITDGKLVYTQYCLSCHQVDGGGVSNMNPPLARTSYVLGDKNRIINILLNGFKEKVEIERDIYNNVMPSFNYLSNQQIADVLTYVRNSFGNKASAVTLNEVNKLRHAKK